MRTGEGRREETTLYMGVGAPKGLILESSAGLTSRHWAVDAPAGAQG